MLLHITTFEDRMRARNERMMELYRRIRVGTLFKKKVDRFSIVENNL